MPLFKRILAFLLVPCILLDPTWAVALSQPIPITSVAVQSTASFQCQALSGEALWGTVLTYIPVVRSLRLKSQALSRPEKSNSFIAVRVVFTGLVIGFLSFGQTIAEDTAVSWDGSGPEHPARFIHDSLYLPMAAVGAAYFMLGLLFVHGVTSFGKKSVRSRIRLSLARSRAYVSSPARRRGFLSMVGPTVFVTTDFSHYGWHNLQGDVRDIFLIPSVAKIVVNFMIAKKLGSHYSKEKYEFAPLTQKKVWIFGLSLYILSAYLRPLGHFIIMYFFNNDLLFELTLNSLSGGHISTNNFPSGLPTYGFVLITLGGQLTTLLYAGILWIVRKTILKSPFAKKGFHLGIAFLAFNLLAVFGLELLHYGQNNLHRVAELLQADNFWSRLLIYAPAILIPALILRKIAMEHIEDIDSTSSGKGSGPPTKPLPQPHKKHLGRTAKRSPWQKTGLKLLIVAG
jgi:hypothetical protein